MQPYCNDELGYMKQIRKRTYQHIGLEFLFDPESIVIDSLDELKLFLISPRHSVKVFNFKE